MRRRLTAIMGWAVAALCGCQSLGGIDDFFVVESAPADATVDTSATPVLDTSSDTWMDSGGHEDRFDSAEAEHDTASLGPPGDRKLTYVFGAPDLATAYVCIVGYTDAERYAHPPDTHPPAFAHGPLGSFSYGSSTVIVPNDATLQTAFDWLYTVTFFTETDPGKDGCKAAWPGVWPDKKRQAAFKAPKGTSTLIAVTGCKGTSDKGECGAGNNLSLKAFPLDITPKTSPAKGVQFLHGSLYDGVEGQAPSWQNVDIYLWPTTGSMGFPLTSTGAPVQIAGAYPLGGGQYNSTSSTATSITMETSDMDKLSLVITRAGTLPCLNGAPPPAMCTASVAYPIRSAGESAPMAPGVNYVLALFGTPVDFGPRIRILPSDFTASK